MFKPQSLETSNICDNNNFIHVVHILRADARIISDESDRTRNSLMCIGNIYSGMSQDKYRWLLQKMNNMDYQYTNVIRQDPSSRSDHSYPCFCQSQSFCLDRSISQQENIPIRPGSRLNASMYMSPPSPHWTPVGRILTVKRSTSMPGIKSKNAPPVLKTAMTKSCGGDSMNKKFQPLKCLRYQFQRSRSKNIPGKESVVQVDKDVTPCNSKEIKSFFKKKPTAYSKESSCSKSRGIKKSISHFFLRPKHSSRSDSSSEDPRGVHIQNEDHVTKTDRSSRRDKNFEATIERDKSLTTRLIAQPTNCIGAIERVRTPSEGSFSDSLSVSSTDQHLSPQTSGCNMNLCSHINDNGWKMVVGHVCRSSSKDSAIANSTLSGDGTVDQSKRISLSSTISRSSDRTTGSEEFHDSSYSSFNDLQYNAFPFSYSKSRKKLKPINISFKAAKALKTQEHSSSSDSSTETLRPVACVPRKLRPNTPLYSSSTNRNVSHISLSGRRTSVKNHKRCKSWPGCLTSLHGVLLTSTSLPSSKPPLPPRPVNKICPHINLKLTNLQQNRVNSSPFLSPYSRLYSLRSRPLKTSGDLCCSPGPGRSIHEPVSLIKYVNTAATVTLRKKIS